MTISPRDPLVCRDGRPFGPGGTNRAYTLTWPYPSMTTGAVRTVLAKLAFSEDGDPFRDRALLRTLKATEVAGPLLLAEGELYLPRAGDAVAYDEGGRTVAALRPRQLCPGEGCDLPLPGMCPIAVPSEVKPASVAPFWSLDRMTQWLAADHVPDGFTANEDDPGFLGWPEVEQRVHVSIDRERRAADEGKVFITEGLAFKPDWALAVRVRSPESALEPDHSRFPFLHPVGGERRLAEFSLADGEWTPPSAVTAALHESDGVRMVLATPAIFSGGWRPGWVDPVSLRGCPPGLPEVRLVLQAACVQRWRPVSGWSLKGDDAGGGPHRPGPKAVRRVVPAGSVYFFRVEAGSAEVLAERLWLESVSDDQQDRLDGFGLAVWGVWNRREGTE